MSQVGEHGVLWVEIELDMVGSIWRRASLWEREIGRQPARRAKKLSVNKGKFEWRDDSGVLVRIELPVEWHNKCGISYLYFHTTCRLSSTSGNMEESEIFARPSPA